jgi:hypothetical protein
MKDLNALDVALMSLDDVCSMLRRGYIWKQIWGVYRLVVKLRPDIAAALVERLHQPGRDKAGLEKLGYTFGPKGMCTGWRQV